MIIIRTKHDLPTEYLFAWSEEVIFQAEKQGVKVNKIESHSVNFKHFEQRVHKLKPRFIFFNGHGSVSSFYDNKMEEFINVESSYLLKDTITYARACDSLTVLGKEAVKKGCISFIGYKKKFLIPRWHKTTCKPLQDVAAKPVLESSNAVAIQLVKGRTVREAIEKSHQMTTDKIIDLLYSRELYASATLAALVHNDFALNSVGDDTARIR